jgi:uncharacterized protein (DUF58 family)
MSSLATTLLTTAVSMVAFVSLPDSISLSLTSDKTVYFKGENVKLTITLENRSLRDRRSLFLFKTTNDIYLYRRPLRQDTHALSLRG